MRLPLHSVTALAVFACAGWAPLGLARHPAPPAPRRDASSKRHPAPSPPPPAQAPHGEDNPAATPTTLSPPSSPPSAPTTLTDDAQNDDATSASKGSSGAVVGHVTLPSTSIEHVTPRPIDDVTPKPIDVTPMAIDDVTPRPIDEVTTEPIDGVTPRPVDVSPRPIDDVTPEPIEVTLEPIDAVTPRPTDDVTESIDARTEAFDSTTIDARTDATDLTIDAETEATDPSINTRTDTTDPTIDARTYTTDHTIDDGTVTTDPSINTRTDTTDPTIDARTYTTDPTIDDGTDANDPSTIDTTTNTTTITDFNSIQPLISPLHNSIIGGGEEVVGDDGDGGGGLVKVGGDPEQEKEDEVGDKELYEAVVKSMAEWHLRRLAKMRQGHRQKRDEEVVCYKDLGCFRDEGPFDYLDLLPSPPEEINTRFLLYTRERGDKERVLKPHNISSILDTHYNVSRPTKLLIHGFGSSCYSVWIKEMRVALMTMMDVNIICVNWQKGAEVPNYVRAASNTRLVGRQVALFLDTLTSFLNNSLDDFHLIGFSLGAHVSGHAGARLKNLSRISGLDPAGPLFESFSPSVRLDHTDARFVDVIHTNADSLLMGGLGAFEPMGHVDFYPNGGRMQKGCANLFIGGFSDILWPTEGDGRYLCNHRRGYKYYLDSVAPVCRFPAFVCRDYETFLQGDCFPCQGCGNMGYFANQAEGRGQLYLVTRDTEPFCGRWCSLTLGPGTPSTQPAEPVTTYGRLDITFIAADGINETLRLTQGEDTALEAGGTTVRILVPHPALTDIRAVQLRYTAYPGWIYSGFQRWALDQLSLMDSFGKTMSFCHRGTTLVSGKAMHLSLLPGECDAAQEPPASPKPPSTASSSPSSSPSSSSSSSPNTPGAPAPPPPHEGHPSQSPPPRHPPSRTPVKEGDNEVLVSPSGVNLTHHQLVPTPVMLPAEPHTLLTPMHARPALHGPQHDHEAPNKDLTPRPGRPELSQAAPGHHSNGAPSHSHHSLEAPNKDLTPRPGHAKRPPPPHPSSHGEPHVSLNHHIPRHPSYYPTNMAPNLPHPPVKTHTPNLISSHFLVTSYGGYPSREPFSSRPSPPVPAPAVSAVPGKGWVAVTRGEPVNIIPAPNLAQGRIPPPPPPRSPGVVNSSPSTTSTTSASTTTATTTTASTTKRVPATKSTTTTATTTADTSTSTPNAISSTPTTTVFTTSKKNHKTSTTSTTPTTLTTTPLPTNTTTTTSTTTTTNATTVEASTTKTPTTTTTTTTTTTFSTPTEAEERVYVSFEVPPKRTDNEEGFGHVLGLEAIPHSLSLPARPPHGPPPPHPHLTPLLYTNSLIDGEVPERERARALSLSFPLPQSLPHPHLHTPPPHRFQPPAPVYVPQTWVRSGQQPQSPQPPVPHSLPTSNAQSPDPHKVLRPQPQFSANPPDQSPPLQGPRGQLISPRGPQLRPGPGPQFVSVPRPQPQPSQSSQSQGVPDSVPQQTQETQVRFQPHTFRTPELRPQSSSNPGPQSPSDPLSQSSRRSDSQPQISAHVSPKTHSLATSNPLPQPQPRPRPRPAPSPQPQPVSARPQPQRQPQPQLQVHSNPQSQLQPQPQSKPNQPQPQSKPSQPHSKPDQPQFKPPPQPQSKPQPESNPSPQSRPQSKPQPQPKPSQPEQPQSKSQPQSKPSPQSQPQSKLQPQSPSPSPSQSPPPTSSSLPSSRLQSPSHAPSPRPQSRPRADSQRRLQPGPVFLSQSLQPPGRHSKPSPASLTPPSSGAKTRSQPTPQPQPQPRPGPGPELQPQSSTSSLPSQSLQAPQAPASPPCTDCPAHREDPRPNSSPEWLPPPPPPPPPPPSQSWTRTLSPQTIVGRGRAPQPSPSPHWRFRPHPRPDAAAAPSAPQLHLSAPDPLPPDPPEQQQDQQQQDVDSETRQQPDGARRETDPPHSPPSPDSPSAPLYEYVQLLPPTFRRLPSIEPQQQQNQQQQPQQQEARPQSGRGGWGRSMSVPGSGGRAGMFAPVVMHLHDPRHARYIPLRHPRRLPPPT
ncbi:TRIO and F-actin-binding protein-like [Eriocheir sinensis]|uniref:TRIO and F-actin-binding protein-like n=1 Tax=Eriocheir sinensis TaxID=95602 RepID=UPI0021C9CE40|nr:TRIO and F-actin-binding protein-like [Eriocheir sinensis]